MAAIFQIRRGTTNISPAEGELYLHQGSGSIQFGSGSTPYNLLPLNAPAYGDINLSGSITASGDVRIGGNIYLGNATADNISALGVFTTNLIPNGTIDLGSSTAKWNNVYGNTVWGAISASNGVISGSAQFVSVLSSLNDYTASQDTKNITLSNVTASFNTATASLNLFSASVLEHIADINTKTGSFENKFSTIQTYTASIDSKILRIQESTSSLNSFTASNSNTSLNDYTASQNAKNTILESVTASFNSATASLNSFSASNGNTSLNSYTSSLETAIELTGSSVTIKGNLVVKGTQTLIDSTTIQIGDNILELNGTAAANGGLLVKDTTGTSGSLLWDSTNDYWKGGTIGNEEKLLRAGSDGIVSGSTQIASVLTSLNLFSASTLEHITDINSKTGSFEVKHSTLQTYTASVNTKFSTLESYTSSIDTKFTTLQSLTASNQSRFIRIEESTASINLTTASLNGHVTDINVWTASQVDKDLILQSYTSSIDTKFTTLQSYTASINDKFAEVQASTSSLNSLTASALSRFTRIEESTSSLNVFSASINAFYNNFTESLSNGGFSASVDRRLDLLEYTASYSNAATIADQFGALSTVTASLMVATGSLQVFTASQEAKNIIIGSYTSSMNTFTASVDGHISDINTWSASVKGHITDINTKTGSLETKHSTLQTYTASIDTKFNTLQSLTASNESRFARIEESTSSLNTFTASLETTYEGRATTTKTIFSGSSQVSYLGLSNIPSGIISSSAQIDTLFNIDGIVSGSSQINFTQIAGISSNIISSSSDTSNVDMIITGGSISANLYGGVVSGSAQVVSILTSLNAFSASNDNTSLNAATSSYETKGRGIVSGSIQVLGGSNVLSGSNQSNITSINQNLGTTSTGVQFASLGIGTAPDATYELKIEGDVAASGDIVAYYTSDKRLKDNIQPIENSLDKVNKLGGYTFDWNEELQKARKGHDIGVIAQEVQSVLPEVVIERENGYLGVDYQKLVPVLIEAIKELTAKVELLEKK